MQRYLNLSGNSNIIAYENGYGYIKVQFSDYSIYTYTYQSAGKENVEIMMECANRGWGLNGFINRYCKYSYSSKQRPYEQSSSRYYRQSSKYDDYDSNNDNYASRREDDDRETLADYVNDMFDGNWQLYEDNMSDD